MAEALKGLLAPAIELQLWNDAFFAAGEYTLESLESRSRAFDGGLIVGTADDRVTVRGEEFDSIRDNLLLEFGMFVATFGRRRALLALEGLGTTKVPSDLYGLTCVGFERTDPLDLGSAAEEIARVIGGYSLDVVDPDVVIGLEGVLRTFLGDLQVALGAPPNVGFHLWVVDSKVDPERLVRVARSRTSPKAQLRKEYEVGDGIVGECWRTAAQVHVDFSEEPYRSISESDWNGFGPGARKGMTFDLLHESRERYRAVGAVPIMSALASGTRFLGCLSYNVGPNVGTYSYEPQPMEVEKVLDRAVEVARILLEAQ